MRRSIRLVLAAVAAAVMTASPMTSSAAEEDGGCDIVVRAMKALGSAERYHWTMSATSPARRRPMEREEVVIGDIVYMTPDEGRWVKAQMPPEEREARVADELARNPVGDCHQVGAEGDGAAALTVYAYREGSASADKRIWVSDQDHRPRRFESVDGAVSITMHVDYDRVEAPLP